MSEGGYGEVECKERASSGDGTAYKKPVAQRSFENLGGSDSRQ